MMRVEEISEMFIFELKLTQLMTSENLSIFIRFESFKSYINNYGYFADIIYKNVFVTKN
jgi:hypothetical protein